MDLAACRNGFNTMVLYLYGSEYAVYSILYIYRILLVDESCTETYVGLCDLLQIRICVRIDFLFGLEPRILGAPKAPLAIALRCFVAVV